MDIFLLLLNDHYTQLIWDNFDCDTELDLFKQYRFCCNLTISIVLLLIIIVHRKNQLKIVCCSK